jgi:hypothetical protein
MKRHQLQHLPEQKAARNRSNQEAQPAHELVETPLPGIQEAVRVMQSLHGNRATASLVTGSSPALSHPVQAKLTVTEAGDQYEQEADRVAEDVVSRMAQPVQREPQEEEELQMKRDDAVQREPQEEEELQMKRDDAVQRKDTGDMIGGMTLTPDVEQSIARARAGGSALDAGIRGQMESHMGADFSGVRVHTGEEADQLTDTLQAKAFTTGQDVFFRSDQYRPSDRNGQQLIAHELTHVIQQNPSVQKKHEREE